MQGPQQPAVPLVSEGDDQYTQELYDNEQQKQIGQPQQYPQQSPYQFPQQQPFTQPDQYQQQYPPQYQQQQQQVPGQPNPMYQQQYPIIYQQQPLVPGQTSPIQTSPIQTSPLQQAIIVQQFPTISLEDQSKKLDSTTMPMEFYCFNCKTVQISVVHTSAGAGTHLMALLLCCFCGLILCWIPYVIQSCQDTIHRCPVCHQEVGRRNFLNM